MGVLAYELCTGHRPFEGTEGRDVERAILETEARRPSTVVAHPRQKPEEGEDARPVTPEAISEARSTTPRRLRHLLEGDLNTIIRTAMCKESERRYASIEAFLGDLDRYRDGQPIQARADSVGYRAKKFVQRNRWEVGIAAAFLGLMVTFGFLLFQQREQAQQEAEKAGFVSSYLVDLFGTGTGLASDFLSAQTLVRRGLDRTARHRDRPVVQAEMLDALGQAARGLGEWEQADSLLQRALILRQQHLDPPHPDLVASLVHVANTRRSARRFWEARPLYEEALEMDRHLGTKKHRAGILEGLGKTMSRQGAPDSAEVLMRKAINLRRREQGGQYHGLSLDQMDLARIVQRQGKHEEAEALYRAALRQMERGTGFTSSERVSAYKQFGDLLYTKEELAAAATYYQRALSLTEETMGRGHPQARRARTSLYETLILRGRYEKALSVARTNLDVIREKHPTDHSARPVAFQRVGHLLDNMGRSAEAEPLLRRAVSLREAEHGADHIRTHATRVRYALCLIERNQRAEAERMLREGRDALEEVSVDSTTVDISHLQAILQVAEGRLYAEARDLIKAQKLLERGYRHRREQAGLRAPLTQRALRELVWVYEASGQPDQAGAYRDSVMVW
jgi:serine/threonine-protein kinase